MKSNTGASVGHHSSSIHTEVYVDPSNSLVTCTTLPLFYTDPVTHNSHLIRLIRLHTSNPSSSASSAAATASTAGTGNSTAAIAAPVSSQTTPSASPSSSSSSSSLSVTTSEVFVRAGDLCMIFLSSKSAINTFVRDFNQPFEKQLLRTSNSPKEVYCLTRKGVKRFLLTKRVKVLPRLIDWIENVLLVLMRPGNEQMSVPPQGKKQLTNTSDGTNQMSSGHNSSSKIGVPNSLDSQPSVDRIRASRQIPTPSDKLLADWCMSSHRYVSQLIQSDLDRAANRAAIDAATPAARGHSSTAGKDWQANGRFVDKATRVDQKKYQAEIEEMLTPKER